jgi:hypothetical protein
MTHQEILLLVGLLAAVVQDLLEWLTKLFGDSSAASLAAVIFPSLIGGDDDT